MKVILYRFSKKVNSTAIPYNGVQKLEIELQVYGDISILSPVLYCEGATGSSPFRNLSRYNYAYIEDFSRYYFVSNVSISGGQWVFNLSVDLLATYRYSITSGTAYIQRANTETAIEKDNLHCTGHITTLTNEGSTGIFGTMGLYYLVGVRGQTNFSISNYSLGNCVYYLMNGSQLAKISSTLWSNSITETIGVNKGDYIISVRPFMGILADIPLSPLVNVYIGSTQVSDLQACAVDFSSANFYSETTLLGIPIPKHPQSTETNFHWLNESPYTSYTGNFGIFGTMSLPTSLLKDRQNLTYKVRTYPMSGDCTLFVYDSNGGVVIRQTVNAMPTIAMSSQNPSISSTIGNGLISALDTLKDSVDGNGVLMSVGNAVESVKQGGFGLSFGGKSNTVAMREGQINNSITPEQASTNSVNGMSTAINVAQAFVREGFNIGGFSVGGVPSISSTGGGGGCYGRHDKPSITGFFSETRDIVPSTEGRAVNKSDTIGNYTGMVQMCLPSINPTGATDTERTQLYSLCNGVIYIE